MQNNLNLAVMSTFISNVLKDTAIKRQFVACIFFVSVHVREISLSVKIM